MYIYRCNTSNILDSPERSPTPPADETSSPAFLTSKDSQSGENRLRPASDILNRLVWDENYDSTDFVIGYEDRFEGRLEASVNSWKRESTDEEFIPQHRILYIKRKSDSEIVWDRRRRIDQIFKSGNSAFDYLAFLH
ncbi:hypothetical protein ASPVEDRAFT_275963 [Aspergillus versicolor CBS 583.65]|uniref:MJ1316 RNA cyclic group end recognition domain-containing protein n=1 Tax=Aspergillus versicolor CBS 583.65 TaxID=1036611 RepID=A0A1L9P6P4_ASPVE|nr:uncharacterized protein ASPVEDRAFT_275963 [Aspergillus versicolor CBS 583.65]OJI97175.1 hypothetical protein ASPVEDRAFT_275963 [Aspergillus versicolor CBS 583.65]